MWQALTTTKKGRGGGRSVKLFGLFSGESPFLCQTLPASSKEFRIIRLSTMWKYEKNHVRVNVHFYGAQFLWLWHKVTPGLGCTTTSQADPPPRLHLLGADWQPWHLKCKMLLSQKVGCTAEVVTQSGTSVHLGWVARWDWRAFCHLGSKSAGTSSCNPALVCTGYLTIFPATLSPVCEKSRIVNYVILKKIKTHKRLKWTLFNQD